MGISPPRLFHLSFLNYAYFFYMVWTLRKHAYSNKLNILTAKKWKFSDKYSNISHTSDQNIDCGYWLEPPRRGGSNEYPQSMFLGRNEKNKVYPCKPQFYYIKVGFRGGQNYIGMFSWWVILPAVIFFFFFFFFFLTFCSYLSKFVLVVTRWRG